jgi:hypothetical protein
MENMVIVLSIWIQTNQLTEWIEHFVQCVQKDSTASLADQLKQLFSSIKKTSAKEDLLWNLKMEMLVTVARREK